MFFVCFLCHWKKVTILSAGILYLVPECRRLLQLRVRWYYCGHLDEENVDLCREEKWHAWTSFCCGNAVAWMGAVTESEVDFGIWPENGGSFLALAREGGGVEKAAFGEATWWQICMGKIPEARHGILIVCAPRPFWQAQWCGLPRRKVGKTLGKRWELPGGAWDRLARNGAAWQGEQKGPWE